MSTPVLTLALALLLFLNPDSNSRSEIAENLRKALGQNEVSILQKAAASAADDLCPWSETGAMLREVAQEEGASLGALRARVKEAHGMLIFEPLMESPMPNGFPDTTPPGEIQLKSYPKYRLARVQTEGIETAAFWSLFAHIKQNKISMTAPVEMTYPSEEDQKHAPTMAFLYGPDAPQETEAAQGVDVLVIDPMTVVSSGHRGWQTPQRVEKAKERLLNWLAEERPDLEVVGPLRVLGYNSPSVRGDRRFFEVQFQIQPAKKKESGRTAAF